MPLLVLSASDTSRITSLFELEELVMLMGSVFSQLSASDPGIHQPHRTILPTENHTALFMPSRIASAGTAMKIVSVPTDAAPDDVKAGGLPASTIVLDERSGSVKAIVNARCLTALRNAAGSILSTKLLLPFDASPTSVVAVGAGAQIQAHLALFLTAYPSLQTCTIFNRSQNVRFETLLKDLQANFPSIRSTAGLLSPPGHYDNPDLRDAIGHANIIITATSSTTPLFPSHYVQPGTHLCLIGSYKPEMHEIDTDLIKRAGKVVVDQKSACLEAGELIFAGLTEDDLVEVGQLYEFDSTEPSLVPRAEVTQAIRTGGDVTIFKSVGVAVQDVAIACAVVDRAMQKGIGKIIADYDGDAVSA